MISGLITYTSLSENQVFLFSHNIMIQHFTGFCDGQDDGGDFDGFNCACH